MSVVHTVSGPVDAADLGLTLVHEHLLSTSEGVRAQFPHLYDREAERRRGIDGVRRAMEHGVKTFVDPAVMDIGRDVQLASEVVDATGIQMVMATGIYGARYTFVPQHLFYRDADYLAEAFVHDIEVGIQGTEVKAAFLKCAVDEPGITDDVEKVLRAVAKASKQTGRPIMAHTHPGTKRGLEVMDLFDEEGVDPATVQLAHTGDTADVEHIEALLARGAFIGMDRYGLDIILPNDERNATVIELCKRGHADRMMLSHDACATIDWFPSEMVEQMAPNWHFTYLFETVLDQLREGGVTDEQIDQMMVANPARWLGG